MFSRINARAFLCAVILGSMTLSPVLLVNARLRAAGQSPQQPQQQDEVLRISTELVQTDVLVLDKQGRAVPGLQRDQFELLVDGQAQPISYFESVEAGSAKEAAQIAAARGAAGTSGQGPAGATSAATLGSAPMGRSLIFFVDDLHLSTTSVQRVRDLLTNMVNTMGQNDQALIISASGQIGFLQQLTDNRAALRLAISRLNYQTISGAGGATRRAMTEYEARAIDRGQRDVLNYKVKEMMDDMGLAVNPTDENEGLPPLPQPSPSPGGGSGGTVDPNASNRPSLVGGTNMNNRRMSAESQIKNEAKRILQHANSINLGLLGALESVARGSASLPGRKLVFFLSDGFILDTKNSDLGERLRRVVDASARSGVVIYAVDTKGLSVNAPDASSDVFSDIADLSGELNAPGDATSMAVTGGTSTREVLHVLAAETGGRAIVNKNDLETGVGKILQETAAYYVLAWKPQQPIAGGPKYKAIKVSVKGRPDLTVQSRRGFFTAPLPATASDTAAAKPAAGDKASEAELRSAIMSPFPRRQLSLASYATLANEPPGEFKTTIFADIAGYQMAPAVTGGKSGGEVDMAIVVLNDTGKSVSGLARKISIPDGAANQPYRIVATLPNALPAGLYQLRIAARDVNSGRMGSGLHWLEVPEFKPGKMTLSSLLLAENKAAAGGAAGDPSKAALDVERRFARSSGMLLQFYVYNATRGANGAPDVTATIQILKNGQAVVSSPPLPVSTEGATDLARLFYSAEFPLEGLPVGAYTLKVTVNDRAAKTNVTQQLDFSVE